MQWGLTTCVVTQCVVCNDCNNYHQTIPGGTIRDQITHQAISPSDGLWWHAPLDLMEPSDLTPLDPDSWWTHRRPSRPITPSDGLMVSDGITISPSDGLWWYAPLDLVEPSDLTPLDPDSWWNHQRPSDNQTISIGDHWMVWWSLMVPSGLWWFHRRPLGFL